MVRAMRAGTWFRLPRQQRELYSLAMRLDVKLQSPELLKALVSVLRSLRERFDGGYQALRKAVDVAWAFSAAAVKGGNKGALAWRHDWNYISFLAISLGS
jgi:hypothetical protein